MGYDRIVRRRSVWAWTIVGLLAFVVGAVVVIVAAVPLTSDALRHRMIDTLSARLDADVTLGDLHWHVFPQVRADGSQLTIRRRGRNDPQPLISISSFTVEAELLGIVRQHVAHVTVNGLVVSVPPDDHTESSSKIRGPHRPVDQAGARADQPSPGNPVSVAGVVIDTLDANGAQVVILPGKPAKAPRVWAVHALRMHTVGAGQKMPFEATLTNGVPPGEIATSGSFGPWETDNPGRTPLDGTFTFAKADLGVFNGISGMLSARGRFVGALGRLVVNGETDTPDFTIKLGGHPFPLHTSYQATVDGTDGDTYLDRIDARFLESQLVAKGSVIGAPPGARGRIVSLDITMDKARIEDVMHMAIKASTPMRGALKLRTKFVLPPGHADVVDRLRLDGQFAMARVRFTNFDVQQKIDELSRRSRGRAPGELQDHVVSDFQGRFKLANGKLAAEGLTFSVPGAKVQLAGEYALKPETLAFRGTLDMDAKVSQTQGGISSFLLKAVDPIFRRRGGGSTIPIRVRGTRSNPDFGLDVGRVFKRGEKS